MTCKQAFRYCTYMKCGGLLKKGIMGKGMKGMQYGGVVEQAGVD